MSRSTHYVPAIGRFLVKVLFHEARRRKMPMTRLVDELLREALQGTRGWHVAEAETAVQNARRFADGREAA